MPTTRANDIQIYFETFGDPADETVLLVSGLGTQATGYEEDFCQGLADRGFHVVRFDNRDVGLSSHLDAEVPDMLAAFATATSGGAVEAPYTLSDMAADAVGLLDSLEVGRAHVYGSSMGGMIVQTLSIEHPDRVRSVTSVMSTTGEPEYGMPDPECLAGLATIMVPAETRAERIDSGIRLQELIGTPGGWDPDQVRRRVAEGIDRCYDPDGTARQMMAILASGDRAEGLSSLEAVTIVLHGDADRLVNISGGRRTAELVADSEFRVMEGMGHDLPPAYWDRAMAAVVDAAARSATEPTVADERVG
ncbi:MAG: alpha/beta hydrolase [Microthrixaceae bacterium]